MNVKNINHSINWDEQDIYERPNKGWLSGVVVETEDGKKHELCFYDPIRLKQELESEIESGKFGFIEKNLIIVKEVTKENIEKAIYQAAEENYFV